MNGRFFLLPLDDVVAGWLASGKKLNLLLKFAEIVFADVKY